MFAVSEGTFGPDHMYLHSGLHSAVQLIGGIVVPFTTVYSWSGGKSNAATGPSVDKIYRLILLIQWI